MREGGGRKEEEHISFHLELKFFFSSRFRFNGFLDLLFCYLKCKIVSLSLLLEALLFCVVWLAKSSSL